MSTATKDLELNYTKAKFNLKEAELYEISLKNNETKLSKYGALSATSGRHTGRSANDKFIVKDSLTENLVDWGKVNRPIAAETFAKLKQLVFSYLNQKELHVQDVIAGADPANAVNVRVVTESAFHALFTRNMLTAINSESANIYSPQQISNYQAEYHVYHAPRFSVDQKDFPELSSGTFILVNYASKEVLIAGTLYTGEIKKSVFSILNFLYPQRGIMPMHSSANTNEKDEVSIFFGLSGTGKTTLSADPERLLIGDDEHGWSDAGVFNFENGCYAKSYGLSLKTEPEIFAAAQRFGATLENVVMDENREPDFNDKSLTENGRISYPLAFIPNAKLERFVKQQPRNIIMLTCDAFGVLPAVAKLSPEEASEHFQLGYTARIPGTEMGVVEPNAVFSPCFGAPFMPLSPKVYGQLLQDKIAKHEVDCWLVNTGWAGGAYGTGKRMSLSITRDIIHRINNGSLAQEETLRHPILNLSIPKSIEMPEKSWQDQESYKQTANKLLKLFEENKI